MKTIELTMSQALVRFLQNQFIELDGQKCRFFEGVWAIFGHGNVAGLGEALWQVKDQFPTYRAHNEQSMAHAAIAFAKANRRQRAMVCTSSIGPGATNMVTSAALAHVNRLPVLFLPGDIFAGRRPDPVLQQIENFADGTVSANDCFRPVSAYFDRITRPEQLLNALPRTMAVLTSVRECGPVTLALCQDTQTESYPFPVKFFEPQTHKIARPRPDRQEMSMLIEAVGRAKQPLIISGGGVLYSHAEKLLEAFSTKTGIPIGETQAGKGGIPYTHPHNLGAIGVTGTSASNKAAQHADLIIGIGTRLQDFTTGSRGLVNDNSADIFQINVSGLDSHKHNAHPVTGDARETLSELIENLEDYRVSQSWQKDCSRWKKTWENEADTVGKVPSDETLPSDAQIINIVNDFADKDAVVVSAAGGLPGELHKLWRAEKAGGYHVEYGYSCMGYEIAGGLGVKLANPDQDVIVMVGDGSYLMANSEIATSVMMGQKLIIVVLDNRGFGCINRLQMSTGSAEFNNLLQTAYHETLPEIDFARHAESLGAQAEFVEKVSGLSSALERAKFASKTYVICLNTDPYISTAEGGHWWDVAVPEKSERKEVTAARSEYVQNLKDYRGEHKK